MATLPANNADSLESCGKESPGREEGGIENWITDRWNLFLTIRECDGCGPSLVRLRRLIRDREFSLAINYHKVPTGEGLITVD